MSIAFNDTTNDSGLIQGIEQELGFPVTYISGNAARLKQWTASINRCLDKVFNLIFDTAYGWQPDDTNQDHYPIQFFDLASGQREYSFIADEDGNLITEILKLAVKDASGIFREIPAVDQQARDVGVNRTTNSASGSLRSYYGGNLSSFIDGRNTTGVPTRYDKTATGIFLDPIPNYNSSGGAKIFLQRESTYFTTSDTTKKPGFSPQHHEYCVLEPCYRYARAHNLKNRNVFKADTLELENAITTHYGRRDRDMLKRLQINTESNK